MLDGFDNTWGIVRESSVLSVFIFTIPSAFVMYLTSPFLFSAQVRPQISDEQEVFIHHVLEIPFEQRKWKDLVTLDTLHAFYAGPEPTTVARRLHAFSRRRKSQLQNSV